MITAIRKWLSPSKDREARYDPNIQYYITDFDRIHGGPFIYAADAYDEVDRMAEKFPGNEIHLLKTVLICKGRVDADRV